jgi:CBS domain-containing protein
MEAGPSTFRPSVALAEMLAYMEKRDMDSALVTTNFGILVGLFHREDAVALQHDKANTADPVNAGKS